MTNLVPLSNKESTYKLTLTASRKGKYAVIPNIITSLKEGVLSNDQIGKIQGLISSASADLNQRQKIDLNNKLSLVLDPKVPGFGIFGIPNDLIQYILTFLSPNAIVRCREIHRNFKEEIPSALRTQLSAVKIYNGEANKIYIKELKLSKDEFLDFPSRIEVLDYSRGVAYDNHMDILKKKHTGTVTHLICPGFVDQKFLDNYGMLFSKVVHLELNYCNRIQSLSFDSLGKYWPNLQYLSLRSSMDAGDREISSITKQWKKLEELDISFTQVTHASAKAISENCPRLKVIHLPGYEGPLFLAGLSCPLLEKVTLRGGFFPSIKQLTFLQEHCPSLENLSLRECFSRDQSPIEDQIIYILNHFKSLQHLDLTGCPISVKVFLAIANCRPGLKVIFWLNTPRIPAASPLGQLYDAILMAIWRKRQDPEIPRLFEKISTPMQDLIKHYLGTKNSVKRIDEIGTSDLPVFMEALVLAFKNTCPVDDERLIREHTDLSRIIDFYSSAIISGA